ncbi:MAG: hypothetical protein MET45_02285 [Nostoc sp. LLA-1]|nr:hypothetical protein [Cyanocohniella sp. LLY]
MEWLFASLLNAGYFGKSHIIWYNSDRLDPSLAESKRSLSPTRNGRRRDEFLGDYELTNERY